VATLIEPRNEKVLLYVILNAYWQPLDFELPPPGDDRNPWCRWIDTALDSPDDITDWQLAPPVPACSYRVQPRSVVALWARMA
jgi:glycogen operon protein